MDSLPKIISKEKKEKKRKPFLQVEGFKKAVFLKKYYPNALFRNRKPVVKTKLEMEM